MFQNYFKIAFRRLLRQYSYTSINIIGLSAGIASFLLIMLYIQYHLSFDRHIPEMKSWHRIVQVQYAEGVGEQHVAYNMGPLAEALLEDIPEIVEAVRVMDWGAQAVRAGDVYFSQNNVAWADPSVVKLFGINLLHGDPSTVLNEPGSVVLSEATATKMFGSADDAYGQSLEFRNESGFMVTGVMQDLPANSHFPLEMLVAYTSAEQSFSFLRSWGSNSMMLYVKLTPNSDPETIANKINELRSKYVGEYTDMVLPRFYLQAVRDIHLRSGHIKFQHNHQQGDYRIILVFITIAILTILIACINFINLAIARSVKRAREVGVRKVMGANKTDLVYQFLGESAIIAFFAMLLALILVEISLPLFNRILGISLSISFTQNPLFNIGLLVIWFIISLLSGIYPALIMSRFRAVDTLKGGKSNVAGLGGWLSRILVVFQFTVAIVLIFVVIVTNRQINFVLKKDLGYNVEHVTALYLIGGKAQQKAKLLKPAIQQIPGVKSVAAASFLNGVAGNQSSITVDDSATTRLMVRFGYVDEDFFPQMNMRFVAGRNFSTDYPNDKHESVILNEAAVKHLGWSEPIGKRFRPFFIDSISKRTVVGVISDYHYYSVHHKIEPAAWIVYPEGYFTLNIKHEMNQSESVIKSLEQLWNQHYPNTPFEYKHAGEFIRMQYQSDENTMKLLTLFTILSLIISGMGLYGLTALRVEQRTREIGIRKVLGASSLQMIVLIMKEFLIMIAIAGLLAVPLGYYFSGLLLSEFAYSVNIQLLDALLAILAALAMAMITILYHAGKAAAANPVESIKYE